MVNSYERLLKRKHSEIERKIYCKGCSKKKGDKRDKGCHQCKIRRAMMRSCPRCCKDRLIECRCRQGRNHASREKEKMTREQMNYLLKDYFVQIEKCTNCDNDVIDYDEVTGDTICYACGLVLDTNNIADQVMEGDGTMIKINKSKEYRTVVYVREKLRGLLGTDPPIWHNEWEWIETYIKHAYGEEWFPALWQMGQKWFSSICRNVLIDEGGNIVLLEEGEIPPENCTRPLANKKYGERWIQARARLGFTPTEKMSVFTLANVCMKVEIYAEVHKLKFRNKITKKNTLNLNYVLLQIIRMEEEEEFQYWKRFIKLSSGKLAEYNKKWETILIELATNHDSYFDHEMNVDFQINWVYQPLYPPDLWIPNRDRFV